MPVKYVILIVFLFVLGVKLFRGYQLFECFLHCTADAAVDVFRDVDLDCAAFG